MLLFISWTLAASFSRSRIDNLEGIITSAKSESLENYAVVYWTSPWYPGTAAWKNITRRNDVRYKIQLWWTPLWVWNFSKVLSEHCLLRYRYTYTIFMQHVTSHLCLVEWNIRQDLHFLLKDIVHITKFKNRIMILLLPNRYSQYRVTVGNIDWVMVLYVKHKYSRVFLSRSKILSQDNASIPSANLHVLTRNVKHIFPSIYYSVLAAYEEAI